MKFKWKYVASASAVISVYVLSYLVHIGIDSHWWVPITAIWTILGFVGGITLAVHLWMEDK